MGLKLFEDEDVRDWMHGLQFLSTAVASFVIAPTARRLNSEPLRKCYRLVLIALVACGNGASRAAS